MSSCANDGTSQTNYENDALHVGPAEFRDAVHDDRWDDVRAMLRHRDALDLLARRDDASVLGKHDRGGGGGHALHVVCQKDSPVDVVDSVCRVDPDAVRARNDAGQSPLFVSCRVASEDVEARLLERDPDAAGRPADDGRLPLHEAVAHHRAPSFVGRLLAVHPAAVRARCRRGRTPVRAFVRAWSYYLNRRYNPQLDELLDAHERSSRDGPSAPLLDDGHTGSSLVVWRETFLLLLEAWTNGRMVDRYRADHPVPWSPLREAYRLDRDTREIPTFFVSILVRLTGRGDYATPDENRDFPLHCVCAQPPDGRSGPCGGK